MFVAVVRSGGTRLASSNQKLFFFKVVNISMLVLIDVGCPSAKNVPRHFKKEKLTTYHFLFSFYSIEFSGCLGQDLVTVSHVYRMTKYIPDKGAALSYQLLTHHSRILSLC